MAKDPAFLFYPGDFLVGVSDLTMDERGQYITLLCLQFTKGHLSEKVMKIAVGKISADVLAKFVQDEDGNYYNERLEHEITKRQKYSESRSLNGSKGGRPKKEIKESEKPYAFQNESICESTEQAYEKHTENENENINDNRIYNTNSKTKVLSFIPTLDEVKEYARGRDRLDLATAFFEYYEAGKWHDKDGKPVKCWKQKFITWCSKNKKPSNGMQASTFDTDDFFQTALQKSYEKMKARLGK